MPTKAGKADCRCRRPKPPAWRLDPGAAMPGKAGTTDCRHRRPGRSSRPRGPPCRLVHPIRQRYSPSRRSYPSGQAMAATLPLLSFYPAAAEDPKEISHRPVVPAGLLCERSNHRRDRQDDGLRILAGQGRDRRRISPQGAVGGGAEMGFSAGPLLGLAAPAAAGEAPLSAGPLSAGPLSAGNPCGPLSAGPLSAGPLSAGPLSAGPLSAGQGLRRLVCRQALKLLLCRLALRYLRHLRHSASAALWRPGLLRRWGGGIVSG